MTPPRPLRMSNHWWWRPGWRAGRRAYTFHVTFDDEAVEGGDQLRRLARDYQLSVQGVRTLDIVPLDWLHLTVQNVGFTDELGAEAVQSVAWRAQERCSRLPPISMRVSSDCMRGLLVRRWREHPQPRRGPPY
jgi:hypothetical protein